eukprot:1912239-Ditylum_brightwellii.AAC.1
MEHWDTVAERGAFAPSDSFYSAGYRRFCKMKQKHENQEQKRQLLAALSENDKEISEDGNVLPKVGISSDNVPPDGKANEVETSSLSCKRVAKKEPPCLESGKTFSLQEHSHDEITDLIRCAMNKTNGFKSTLVENSSQNESDNSLHCKATRALHKELEGCALELNPVQVNAMNFVENVWEHGSRPRESDDASCSEDESRNIVKTSAKNGTTSVGAILYGGIGCGKTITVGALLWKHRNEGPQLIICPPTSV